MTDNIFPDQTPHGGAHARAGHVYKVVQLVGSSETSIQDAIEGAVARASATLRHMGWFEVVQTRGHIENGKIHHYQVTLNIGFTLDEAAD